VAIVSGYAQAATELGVAVGQGEPAAGRFLTWLAGTDRRWLVVLDDLSDPADVRGLWPPHRSSGRVLVTTRRRDAALSTGGRRLVEVGLFTPAEAAAYLAAKLGGDPARLIDADGLAADLGHLPIALAQAAAYMIDRGLDCASYRRRFADRARRLPDVLPEHGALPDDHRTTVAVTWSLSVDLADQLQPVGLARPVLELASVGDPNGIPLAVFTSSAALSCLTTAGADRDTGTSRDVGAEDAVDALHCLHRLSLVSLDLASTTRAVQVHALVQRATRERLDPGRFATVVAAAADALGQAWPEMERDSALVQVLRANTDAVRGHGGDLLWAPDGHEVLFIAGESLAEARLFTAALTYWQQLHTAAAQRLGPDHPDTLTIRQHLATWPAPRPPARPFSPIGCGCWDRTTLTLCSPAATSPGGGERPGTRPARSPRSRRSSPTISGCRAQTTPTPCAVASSPASVGHRPGTRPAPRSRTRSSPQTNSGCRVQTTPIPSPPAATSLTVVERPGTWPARSPRSRRSSPTKCGCTARTTPTP